MRAWARGARGTMAVQEESTVATETKRETLPPVRELTEEESRQHFDALARKHLGISAEEFWRRLDAGEYADIVDDPIDHPWVGRLAQLSNSVR